MRDYSRIQEYFFNNQVVPTLTHLGEVSPRTEITNSTANSLELASFYHEIFPETRTLTGSIMLAYSLISPPRGLQDITERQEAVKELKENDGLRKRVDNALGRIYQVEKDALWLFAGEGSDNKIMAARDLIKNTIGPLGSLDEIESPYLKRRVESLRDLQESDVYKLSRGQIYRQGFRTPLHSGQLNLWELPWTVPSVLSHLRVGTGLVFSSLVGATCYGIFSPLVAQDPSLLDSAIAFTVLATGSSGFASALSAGSYERFLSIPPLVKKLRGDEGAIEAFGSFGSFDEILTLAKLAKSMEDEGHKISLPEIVESERQRISCQDLVNVFQAKNTRYIPNKDIDLGSNGESLTFITGPNSGGKTSVSKAITMLQILGQMGSYVPARNAVLSPADRIIYQVGLNDSQMDGEGGYGTQLAQTREILETAGPHSFVVVDDLMAGTEESAMAKQTRNQFYGLHHTGANVLMITHRHDLANEFLEKTGRGNYLQIEFDGNIPTRQLVPGIAPTSRPDLVEERVNMGEGSIERLLRNRGMLREDQRLYDVD